MPNPGHLDQRLREALRMTLLQVGKIVMPANQPIRPLGLRATALVQGRMVRVGVLLPQQVGDIALHITLFQLRR